jgi:hypothetical protein
VSTPTSTPAAMARMASAPIATRFIARPDVRGSCGVPSVTRRAAALDASPERRRL